MYYANGKKQAEKGGYSRIRLFETLNEEELIVDNTGEVQLKELFYIK